MHRLVHAVLIVCLAVLWSCAGPTATFEQRRAEFAEFKRELLTNYDLSDPQIDPEELFSPGVGRDGIAALDYPEHWNVQDATYPDDAGRVAVVQIGQEAVAYPLGILAVHEIANDWVGGVPIAVTYCPLCDSVSVVDRRLPGSDEAAEFGVSGMLCRSNLTMYDRTTNSLWSQVGMNALTGPQAGRSLRHLPVRVIRFDRFRREHPGGQVLSTVTGFDESYEDDPYQEYFRSDRLYMPVEHGTALPPKTLGMGVRVGDYSVFVPAGTAGGQGLRFQTPQGPVVVVASEAGMELATAPADAQSVQTFYFAWSAFHPDSRIIGTPSGDSLLDGTEKSMVVVGYSTSYVWPTMLQQMLDDHAGQRVYHVLNAVVGGAAVDRWIAEPGTSHYRRTMAAMERDFFGPGARLRGEAPEPTIALCQQSLQFTRSRGPAPSARDREGIRAGADALETLAQRLRDRGIEQVYYAMHLDRDPVAPEVGHERLALDELLARGLPFVFEGPDLRAAARDEPGMKMMAEAWYRTVAGSTAREDVVARMHAIDYDVQAMMRDYVRWRRGE